MALDIAAGPESGAAAKLHRVNNGVTPRAKLVDVLDIRGRSRKQTDALNWQLKFILWLCGSRMEPMMRDKTANVLITWQKS